MIFQRATRLSLQGPNYDDQTIQYLLKLRRLESLSLSRTKFSPGALAQLERGLPHCRIDAD
jgi:hypothetical protein